MSGDAKKFDLAELVANPILVKSVRSRLRTKHILSWGLVVFTVVAFFTTIIFLTSTERGMAREDAAKLTIIPIIYIQGIVLMLLGTGAVASQLAIERDKGLLDYQRMTPMSPGAKILGYLLGLPVREYFLFAVTVPFLAFAIVVGEISLFKIGQFYLVFFSSVWLYHMTGLTAGMMVDRPWKAAALSSVFVILLYWVLPPLSQFGLTFFQYLTVYPTFYSMVGEELASASLQVQSVAAQRVAGLNQQGDVPFFDLELNSTIFTLMVQFFLLGFMYRIVHRKWRDQFSLPFSKFNAIAFYSGVLFLVVGSLWPILGDSTLGGDLMGRVGGMPLSAFLFTLLLVLLLVCGVAAIVVINLSTPDRHTQIRALRRAQKLGASRVSFNADGASSRAVAVAIALLTIGGFWLLLAHVDAAEQYLEQMGGLWSMLAPVIYVAAVVLFAQAVRERYSGRMFLVSMFLLWVLPFFTSMVLFAAFEAWIAGSYVGIVCPPIGLWFLLANLVENSTRFPTDHAQLAPYAIVPDLQMLTLLGVGLYASLAGVFQWRLHCWQIQRRRTELGDAPLIDATGD